MMTRRTGTERAAGAALACGIAAGLFTGCSSEGPDGISPSCNAINLQGENIWPDSYPIGPVDVEYRTPNGYEKAEGMIKNDQGTTFIDVKDFPKDLHNFEFGVSGREVAAWISSASLGRVAFTAQCVSKGKSNNLPTTFIEAPTSMNQPSS